MTLVISVRAMLAGFCLVGASTPAVAQKAVDKPVVASPVASTSADTQWSALLRMTLVSADIERSKKFYTEVFGYTVRFDGEINQPEARTLMALAPSDRARFIVLNGPTTMDGKPVSSVGIGLIAVSGAKKLPALDQPIGNRLASGQAMMAINTTNFDRVLAQLRKLGAPIVSGPIVGHGGTEIEIVTRDPDGTRIHVVGHLTH